MAEGLCLCDLIPSPPLAIATRLVLVIHYVEARKPTNTGLLAAACVAGSEVIVRGREGAPSAPVAVAEGTTPLLLFPADGARALAPSAQPVTLIVPDGTWAQTRRVRTRVPGLRDVPCAVLPPGPPSAYRLRTEHDPAGVSTMEAIARALGILEGPETQAVLEHLFRIKVERTLWSRGALPAHAVTGGVPPAAIEARDRRARGGSSADDRG